MAEVTEDRQNDGQTDRNSNSYISHPAISRCDKKATDYFLPINLSICSEYSKEPSQNPDSSIECPLLMVWLRNKEINFQFLVIIGPYSPKVLTCVLGAQSNHLMETVLLSAQNICFGREIRKLVFN